MPELTAENVYGMAVTYAAAYPDAVYEPPEGLEHRQCYYTRGTLAGRQGCLFGQVLMDLGVPRETLEAADTVADGVPITALLEGVLGLHFSSNELANKIQRVQRWQDRSARLGDVFNG